MPTILKESECAKQFAVLKALDRMGQQRRVFTEEKRHKAAGYEAALERQGAGRIKKLGGRGLMGTMDPLDYFDLVAKYGRDEVHSPGFIKQHFNRFPEHRVKKY